MKLTSNGTFFRTQSVLKKVNLSTFVLNAWVHFAYAQSNQKNICNKIKLDQIIFIYIPIYPNMSNSLDHNYISPYNSKIFTFQTLLIIQSFKPNKITPINDKLTQMNIKTSFNSPIKQTKYVHVKKRKNPNGNIISTSVTKQQQEQHFYRYLIRQNQSNYQLQIEWGSKCRNKNIEPPKCRILKMSNFWVQGDKQSPTPPLPSPIFDISKIRHLGDSKFFFSHISTPIHNFMVSKFCFLSFFVYLG
eukprot:TRINITY_DN3237_c0_g1_i8.p3 TRINITY_DN3237_c0_g1~~TRINITY_DN3237_c0_g1_i8.p3  ORF type:complete len:246 (-),score=0.75 TRINITY_DN3237_c0_g1_i8:757-1494(-)